MVAKNRNFLARLSSRFHDQCARGHVHFFAVYRHANQLIAHALRTSKAHAPVRTWASYSSRKYFMLEWTNCTEESERGQMVVPIIFAPTCSKRSKSSIRPWPASMRASTR